MHGRLAEQASLLDKAQDAIIVRDLDHRITYWNKSAERLYGWTAAEVLGTVAPDRESDPAVFDEAMRRLLEHGDWMGELAQVGKDGRRLTVESRWTLVQDDAGGAAAVLVINTDITERKQARAAVPARAAHGEHRHAGRRHRPRSEQRARRRS